MKITDYLSLNAQPILYEMRCRQEESWNYGKINDRYDYPYLNELFRIINSGIPKEDFMYQGNLFRIHSASTISYENIDLSKNILISDIYSDGSCGVLTKTELTDKVVAFSKNPDFTRRIFYKIKPSQKAIILFANTNSLYGIDINEFYKHFGVRNPRFEEEKEVLFPIFKENIIKEYQCTPRQFKYYMRSLNKR